MCLQGFLMSYHVSSQDANPRRGCCFLLHLLNVLRATRQGVYDECILQDVILSYCMYCIHHSWNSTWFILHALRVDTCAFDNFSASTARHITLALQRLASFGWIWNAAGAVLCHSPLQQMKTYGNCGKYVEMAVSTFVWFVQGTYYFFLFRDLLALSHRKNLPADLTGLCYSRSAAVVISPDPGEEPCSADEPTERSFAWAPGVLVNSGGMWRFFWTRSMPVCWLLKVCQTRVRWSFPFSEVQHKRWGKRVS